MTTPPTIAEYYHSNCRANRVAFEPDYWCDRSITLADRLIAAQRILIAEHESDLFSEGNRAARIQAAKYALSAIGREMEAP